LTKNARGQIGHSSHGIIIGCPLGSDHKIRTQFFEIFDLLPFSLVTQNRINPYIFTEVRNKSLTPSPLKRYVFYESSFSKLFKSLIIDGLPDPWIWKVGLFHKKIHKA
jgi:hypothetical protein